MAPTVSVVAETEYGFAYDLNDAIFTRSTREVMERYVDRSWAANFDFGDWPFSQDKVLTAVEKHNGSISRPTASSLGVPVGKLRILIEQMGLDREVNAIRKRYKRRPAKFREEEWPDISVLFYEVKLPAGY